MNRKDYLILGFAFAILTGYILLTLNNPFFWDTILLGSKHALWYYRNGAGSFLLPDSLDCGHIPFTGFYLAIFWKLFGWSGPVSHLAMLPWVLGIAYQLWRLIKKLVPEKVQLIAFILVLADPTLLTQMGLVSPDVILVFCFLMAVNAILANRKIVLAIALTGLVLSSLRGMMMAAALFLFNALLLFRRGSVREMSLNLFSLIPAWIPAALITMGYLGYHYLAKGWIGYQEGSAWAGNFDRVTFPGLVRNILVLGWRFIDFGRLFLWLIGFWMVFRFIKPFMLFKTPYRVFTLLWISMFLLFVPVMVMHKGSVNHRYLIPMFIIFSLLVVTMIANSELQISGRRIVFALAVLALLTGNLWRYPEGIATGWDSTLAHWPWYKIRHNVHEYIRIQKIDPSTVGTDYPELSSFESIEPGTGTQCFSPIDTINNKYIFWSNIMNGFPDDIKAKLDSGWIRKQEWKSHGIRGIIYQNPQH